MFSYSYDNLKRIVETEHGKAFDAKIKKQYDEKYADRPIYALEYSQFKRFYIDGDRSSFQAQYFDRRRRLMLLQVFVCKMHLIGYKVVAVTEVMSTLVFPL